MKNIFFYLLLCSSLFSDAQTQQNINKNTGTVSNVITTIDSIRFHGSSTIMEVVLHDGTVESHSLSDIFNVNFAPSSSQHSCGADSVHNPNLIYGNMTDQEGNEYKTIVIGNQEWMAENLKTTFYQNGDSITNVTVDAEWAILTTGAWSSFLNDSRFDCPYGKFYNWYAVDDQRKLCPAGWHVPSDGEWDILIATLDSQYSPAAVGSQSTIAGAMLKSIGTQYWASPNEPANNESGFSGLPASNRYSSGNFCQSGVGYWWSSSVLDTTFAWIRWLNNSTGNVYRYENPKLNGISVRCLKD